MGDLGGILRGISMMRGIAPFSLLLLLALCFIASSLSFHTSIGITPSRNNKSQRLGSHLQTRQRSHVAWSCTQLDRAFLVAKPKEPSFLEGLFGIGKDQMQQEGIRAALKSKLGAAVNLNQGAEGRKVVESYLVSERPFVMSD